MLNTNILAPYTVNRLSIITPRPSRLDQESTVTTESPFCTIPEEEHEDQEENNRVRPPPLRLDVLKRDDSRNQYYKETTSPDGELAEYDVHQSNPDPHPPLTPSFNQDQEAANGTESKRKHAFTFINTHIDDLRWKDIPQLLEEYKALAQECKT